MLNLFREEQKVKRFRSIRINLASPEMIRSWSHGEVRKPETINYRTFKPEKDGLFCERIFGPVKDWECACGKYKRNKNKGVICDRCQVEVTQAKVRRERMGHIELAAMVSHIWYFKGLPSRIGNILDMTLNTLERVLYYENYVVINPGGTDLKQKQLLSEEEYRKYKEEYKSGFVAKMGAEGVVELLADINLDVEAREVREELLAATSEMKRKKLIKRLKVLDAFRKSKVNKPEWMILSIVPVIPAELRPLVPLDGGRFATSDLNDLYRRVINRNNRLKKLVSLRAPDVIIRNEKRMLQEAVDALFDNGRRGRVVKGAGNRPLKSLSSMLKGKQGRFRQNLLGKRVDYSGRSVIVVGPNLKMHQCGLPKSMALELFKPFIIKELDEKGFVNTIKGAKKMVEDNNPEVWDILDSVIKGHCVLLNRAPTLHRLGIQAFEPVLVEGKAIKIHPLVCTAFNADFDGDQMAVHVPLSIEAQLEAKMLMLSINNLLSPSNGKPVTTPTQDIVLGCAHMTYARYGCRGEGTAFADMDDVIAAYDHDKVELHARIRLRYKDRMIDTTVGRVLFNSLLPDELEFFNEPLSKGKLERVVTACYEVLDNVGTAEVLDRIKELGFEYATRAGCSICIDDMLIPDEKTELIAVVRKLVDKLEAQYRRGIITYGEKHNKIVDAWTQVTEEITDKMFNNLIPEKAPGVKMNSIYLMAESGARGNKQQIRQLAGMRGLMAKPSGEIIEQPITSNFREGLTVMEYFISTHGARKGLADTALKTADAGYLTRRLVDVAQDMIVNELDCKTTKGITVTSIKEGDNVVESLADRLIGRVVMEDIYDPVTEELIVGYGKSISDDVAQQIDDCKIEEYEQRGIKIRSVLTCETKRGICAMCYGRDLATGNLVSPGTAVGVIAAQSIGEPGTQLTMRTFHIGGTASRVVAQSKNVVKNDGKVGVSEKSKLLVKNGNNIVMSRYCDLWVEDARGRVLESYKVNYGAEIKYNAGDQIKAGETLVEWDSYNTSVISEHSGKVQYLDVVENVTMREELDRMTGLRTKTIVEHKVEHLQPKIAIIGEDGEALASYYLPTHTHLFLEEGDAIAAGDVLGKIPRSISKTKDITGGLPRVAELFEARRPKEMAIITEIDGVVKFEGFSKGQRKIRVENPNGTSKEYIIPQGRRIDVRDGEYIEAGEPLMDGALNPHDILMVKGEFELYHYLIKETQEVYRLQGVRINDKHIEVIVRQMMQKVVVTAPGDSEFLKGEEVDKGEFMVENETLMRADKAPASGQTILLGITKASLRTTSFISAASFQETTRVLTEAAIRGKVDHLRGLKENVIMGNLIPAGTGMDYYRDLEIVVENGNEYADQEEVAVSPVEPVTVTS